MSENKSNTVVEKLILFAVFLVFAGIVVAFAFKWNYVGEDTSSQSIVSLQYITSSKSATSEIAENDSTSSAKPSVTGKVNINTATVEELDTLPDIGPAKAKAIIQYRETESKFFEIEDIKKVSGIGDKTFEKLKDYITVE